MLGDDQVFDVELDRHTELLPVREDVRKVSWENAYIPEPAHTEKAVEEDEEPEPGTSCRTAGSHRLITTVDRLCTEVEVSPTTIPYDHEGCVATIGYT